MHRKLFPLLASLLLVPLMSTLARESLQLGKLFRDQMVIQRDTAVPIWGKAAPKEKVQVEIKGKRLKIRADKKGYWQAELPPQSVGKPFDLKVSSGKEQIHLHNILAGDVWFSSGQSNMEWPVHKSRVAKQAIKEADNEQIRYFQVDRNFSYRAIDTLKGIGEWQKAAPGTVGDWSAVAYFFAQKVYQETKVPIGIISSNWGGTTAEAWTASAYLKDFPHYRQKVEELKNMNPARIAEIKKAYKQEVAEWEKQIRKEDKGFASNPPWYSSDFNASMWNKMKLPQPWESAGLGEFDGVVWFRKKVKIKEDIAGQEIEMYLSKIDDVDMVWWDGTKVGQGKGWNNLRTYKVPADLATEGEHMVTIRVLDNGMNGGIWGDKDNMRLEFMFGPFVNLAGEWAYNKSMPIDQMPKAPDLPLGLSQHDPSVLFNAMVRPLTRLPIKGVIWYQGESNAGRPMEYRNLFPQLILSWRKAFEQENLPFYFVQLANYGSNDSADAYSYWAYLREAQSSALNLPHTGMATAVDIGEPNNIHPKNKQEVGKRLAYLALAHTYDQENFNISYPVYRDFEVQGDTAIIHIEAKDWPLTVQDKYGYVRGFKLAGPDQGFRFAQAILDGDVIKVWHPEVENPKAVRYAWSDNPEDMNVYNEAGLPLLPFRTDDWEEADKRKE